MKHFTLASVLLAAAFTANAADYTLPFEMAPTYDQVMEGTITYEFVKDGKVVSNTNTSSEWYYENFSMKHNYYPSNSNRQDWAFLPAVDFGNSDKVKISVDVYTDNESFTDEGFALYLGKEATFSAMTIPVMSYSHLKNPSVTTYTQEVDVTPGTYNLGLLVTSPEYAGTIYFKNFKIESLHEAEVPAGPTASATGNMDGGYTQKTDGADPADYLYNLAYTIDYNADKTLSISGNWTWKEGTPVGAIETQYIIVNGVEYSAPVVDGKITTTATFEPGDEVTVIYKLPVALGSVEPKVVYVVGEETATAIPTEVVGNNTGISAIDAENGAVEYFNLAGVRVANPEKGSMVIARQGGKVVKMIIR